MEVKEYLEKRIAYLNREIINSKEDFDNADDWHNYIRPLSYQLQVLEDELGRVENE